MLVNGCMFGVSVLSVGLNQPFTMHYEVDEVRVAGPGGLARS